MKKSTIAIHELGAKLGVVAGELLQRADLGLDSTELKELLGVDESLWPGEFFSISSPREAPAQGRGERARVLIGWVWAGTPATGKSSALLIRSMIAAIPGVEEVTEPELDPQFRLVWSAQVVIRLAQ